MLARVIGVSMIVAVIVVVTLLQTTAPSTAGPLGILAVFIFMYLSVLGLLTFLIFGGSRVIARLIDFINPKKRVRSLSLVRAYYFSSVIAIAPIIFIGMQSVGGASFYDVLLVILFVIVACFYIAKRTA